MTKSEMDAVRRIVREELHTLLTEIKDSAELWNDYDTDQIKGAALDAISSTMEHVLRDRIADGPADKSDDARENNDGH